MRPLHFVFIDQCTLDELAFISISTENWCFFLIGESYYDDQPHLKFQFFYHWLTQSKLIDEFNIRDGSSCIDVPIHGQDLKKYVVSSEDYS